ncbi:MAG: hypothetical protein ACQCN6_08235 [Candidatus Bathyarchaeia archaeon]
MAVCPHCGKDVANPTKELKNQFFCIKGYHCNQCDSYFKLTNCQI